MENQNREWKKQNREWKKQNRELKKNREGKFSESQAFFSWILGENSIGG